MADWPIWYRRVQNGVVRYGCACASLVQYGRAWSNMAHVPWQTGQYGTLVQYGEVQYGTCHGRLASRKPGLSRTNHNWGLATLPQPLNSTLLYKTSLQYNALPHLPLCLLYTNHIETGTVYTVPVLTKRQLNSKRFYLSRAT